MSNITIIMRDGTKREFKHEGRTIFSRLPVIAHDPRLQAHLS